jgi:hypothetical protein
MGTIENAVECAEDLLIWHQGDYDIARRIFVSVYKDYEDVFNEAIVARDQGRTLSSPTPCLTLYFR